MSKFRLAVSAILASVVMAVTPVSAKTVNAVAKDGTLTFAQTMPLSISGAGSLLLGTLTQTSEVFGDTPRSLSMSVSGIAGSAPFVLDLVYEFARNGGGPGCTGPRCSRFIGISTILAAPVTVQSGNFLYTIAVDGFVEALGEAVMAQFISARNDETRNFFLQGTVTVTEVEPAAVPLPGAGLMLLGALGAIAVIRRRTA